MKFFLILAQGTDFSLIPNSDFIEFHSNGTLEIKDVSKEHEGIYQCIISNGVGSDLKKDISIKVIGKFN